MRAPRSLLLLPALILLRSTIAAASADAATDTLGWPQFGRTAQHLNVNPDEQAFSPATARRLRVAWKDHYGDNSTSESGPVVRGGFAYIAGTDGNLSAFPAAGCGAASCEPLWQRRTGSNITGSAAVAGGLVLVGSADHFLYAFPAAGCGGAVVCQPLSLTQLGPDQFYLGPSIAVTGGRVMLGSTDNTDGHSNLYVLDVGP